MPAPRSRCSGDVHTTTSSDWNEEDKMKAKFLAFLREEEALTTVEYAIAGGLVGAAVIAAFLLLGQEVGRIINLIAGALQAITP